MRTKNVHTIRLLKPIEHNSRGAVIRAKFIPVANYTPKDICIADNGDIIVVNDDGSFSLPKGDCWKLLDLSHTNTYDIFKEISALEDTGKALLHNLIKNTILEEFKELSCEQWDKQKNS